MMSRSRLTLLSLFAGLLGSAGSASAQSGELVCDETRVFESFLHADFHWRFEAVAGQRYSFESARTPPPHSISLAIWLGTETVAYTEVNLSDEPARICDWEAPETAAYWLVQVHTGGTFEVTMRCGTLPEWCAVTPVQTGSWSIIKSLFR